MKILYSYFDFCNKQNSASTTYGLGECGLNFSTTHDFFVSCDVGSDGKKIYRVSCQEKVKQAQIQEGFWGERIYNITAMVGSNGTGKSSLIHSLIKAIVMGLDPGVPFLLVLQKTGSSECLLYHSKSIENKITLDVATEGLLDGVEICSNYPKELKLVKIMLIDNTLSTSSINLDKQYNALFWEDKPYLFQNTVPDPILEDVKQLYNKSLVAAVRYSNEMSTAKQLVEKIPVSEELSMYFRYETYQEARFLFDRFQQSTLSDLDKAKYPVPKPKYLYVSVFSLKKMHDIAGGVVEVFKHENLETPPVCMLLHRCGLLGKLIANALFSYYYYVYLNNSLYQNPIIGKLMSKMFSDEFEHNEKEVGTVSVERAKEIALSLSHEIDPYSQEGLWATQDDKDAAKNLSHFIQFLVKNEDTLKEVFEPVVNSSSDSENSVDGNAETLEYRIEIQRTIGDKTSHNFVIDFLEEYRLVCNDLYFLSFSSGLSSGEKNLLRMLTQFRYALHGPAVYERDRATESNTKNQLINKFFPAKMKENDSEVCDTLFLFLDEADLTYHPEWQRQFVSLLTAVLPKLFRNPYNIDSDRKKQRKDGCKDIQVILATHSPLMLGDFPRASTIYLKRDATTGNITKVVDQKQQSTFGENLYTMLKDGFFMEDTIGEFAKQKIRTVAAWCGSVYESRNRFEEKGKIPTKKEKQVRETWTSDLNKHRSIVGLLPPGIIRSKLQAELDMCERFICDGDEKKRLVDEKERLQEQLARVEQQLNALGENHASNS